MNWSKKVLWFAFGGAVVALLMGISTLRVVEAGQTLEQRVSALEKKVAGLEGSIKGHQKMHDDERRSQERDGGPG